ncbi:MAG: SpoIIE family protein phosphatase [Oscillospiraceae bacterium]|nr:SpoIIE family protein phosphatase [Oscillospiraceae bacterium]
MMISDMRAYSNRGGRECNEDACFSMTLETIPGEQVWLGVVIDGISMSNGRISSAIALESLFGVAVGKQILPRLPELVLRGEAENAIKNLSKAMQSLIYEIHEALNDNVAVFGDMGCAVSAALLAGEHLFVSNAGDCPVLLVTKNGAREVYEDHRSGGSGLNKFCGTPRAVIGCADEVPVQSVKLSGEGILLVGSDGMLKDAMSDRERDETVEAALLNAQSMDALVRKLSEKVAESTTTDDNNTLLAVRYSC